MSGTNAQAGVKRMASKYGVLLFYFHRLARLNHLAAHDLANDRMEYLSGYS